MWKIIGKDAMYLEFAEVWKSRVEELSEKSKNGKKFRDILKKSNVSHMMNGSTEVHSFMVDVPTETTPEDIQLMADVILEISKEFGEPFVTLNDNYEECTVTFTSEREPEILGNDKRKDISAGAVFVPIIQSWGGGRGGAFE